LTDLQRLAADYEAVEVLGRKFYQCREGTSNLSKYDQ